MGLFLNSVLINQRTNSIYAITGNVKLCDNFMSNFLFYFILQSVALMCIKASLYSATAKRERSKASN